MLIELNETFFASHVCCIIIWVKTFSMHEKILFTMKKQIRVVCNHVIYVHTYYPLMYFSRAKHPVKVHVWAGTSCRGATGISIFDGIMTATLYTQILEKTLLPFIKKVYPDGHRFQQDNDPKHTSQHAEEYMEENNINWWRTPPESPDANPIENIWHELKQYCRRVVKSTTKDELVNGVKQFWETVNIDKCTHYMQHGYATFIVKTFGGKSSQEDLLIIYSKEGATQGCPLAMLIHAVAIQPLIF